MTTTSSGESVADAVVSASRLTKVKYANVASLTILTFDWIITFGNEVELIWKSNWGVGKVLFLLSRYSAFFDTPLNVYYSVTPHIPMHRCRSIYTVTTWSTVFGIGMAEAILVLRTYALWACDKKILGWLILLYTSVFVPCVVFVELFLRSIKYGPPPLDMVPGCYLTDGSSILFADFALLMIYETVILGLTIWQGVRSFRHSSSPLIHILYRDGVFYFFYLFIVSAGNIVVLVALPREYVDLLNTFQRVVHSVVSTRILLHIREAASQNEARTIPSASPILQFARNHGFFNKRSTMGTVTDDTFTGVELKKPTSPPPDRTSYANTSQPLVEQDDTPRE